MTIPVLVPWRPDGGRRDDLWRYVRRSFWSTLPGFRIVTGRSPGGPFNRSAAVNDAAALAGNWRVAVIADNDTWVPPAQLLAAVDTATKSQRLTAAFSRVVELSRDYTDGLLDGSASLADFNIDWVRTEALGVQSSMLVVPRELWNNIGGFDEKFAGGWGGEDNAFWRAASILAGEPMRVPGCAFHLWHEPAATDAYKRYDPGYRANLARWNRYRVASTVPQLRQAQR
jgi:hypothetical protein